MGHPCYLSFFLEKNYVGLGSWGGLGVPVFLEFEIFPSSYNPAAAKSPQLCPALCDPIDGSPLGSAVPGILQARTLEWVAISFSSASKWKVKVKSLSHSYNPTFCQSSSLITASTACLSSSLTTLPSLPETYMCVLRERKVNQGLRAKQQEPHFQVVERRVAWNWGDLSLDPLFATE